MSENQTPEQPEFNADPKPTPPPFKQPVASAHPYQGMHPQALPNSTVVLVLGILSILSCCCYGVPGLILSIIGLVLGNKDKKLYNENPSIYTESSYKNSKAGRICSIIALGLSILYILLIIVMILVFGFAALQDPQHMREMIEAMQAQ